MRSWEDYLVLLLILEITSTLILKGAEWKCYLSKTNGGQCCLYLLKSSVLKTFVLKTLYR